MDHEEHAQPSRVKPVVAIAGATGFVGDALCRALLDTFHVVALTRSPTRTRLPDNSGIEWRYCDLFSMRELDLALENIDYAIYLVHSMLPSARLVQANFSDLDLLLADNFARAAEKSHVKQILYVGGIRPPDTHQFSRHIQSRLEVESALASRKPPMTALRAGMIIGPGGSSLRILVQLVRRLPLMILPQWTHALSAPIALDDLVRAVRRTLANPEAFDQSFEIGGPEIMSYREMIARTASVLARQIPMINVPIFSPTLSTRWVAWVTGSSDTLVGPLIESLQHEMVPKPNWLQSELSKDSTPFESALKNALDEHGALRESPRNLIKSGDAAHLKRARTVRSVQRLPLPPNRSAEWVADEYARWLPSCVWPILNTSVSDNGVIYFRLRGVGWTLLELTHSPPASRPDRHLFLITGGLLAQSFENTYRGRLEFREVSSGSAIIAAIHDFRPRLPWYIYNLTQALVHLWVMKSFGRHLRRLSAQSPLSLPSSTS